MWEADTMHETYEGEKGIRQLAYDLADECAADIIQAKINKIPYTTPTITGLRHYGKKDREWGDKAINAFQKVVDKAIEDDLILWEEEEDYENECQQFSYM